MKNLVKDLYQILESVHIYIKLLSNDYDVRRIKFMNKKLRNLDIEF